MLSCTLHMASNHLPATLSYVTLWSYSRHTISISNSSSFFSCSFFIAYLLAAIGIAQIFFIQKHFHTIVAIRRTAATTLFRAKHPPLRLKNRQAVYIKNSIILKLLNLYRHFHLYCQNRHQQSTSLKTDIALSPWQLKCDISTIEDFCRWT